MSFKAARDFLLNAREDYSGAVAGFQWPSLPIFNWALDWFDCIASSTRANQTALWIVREDGTETKLSFRELSERSSRVANHLRQIGIRRGERVLLLLSNVPELWESMLALIKLGAVIIPTTTLMNSGEIAERVARERCVTSFQESRMWASAAALSRDALAFVSAAVLQDGTSTRRVIRVRLSSNQRGRPKAMIRCSFTLLRVPLQNQNS